MDLEMEYNLQKYTKVQKHGTVYVATRMTLEEKRASELAEGAGELFLTRIHKRITPDELMHVATALGVVYMLRFKIDFMGGSRGFAYLQYVDDRLKDVALDNLQHLFRMARMKVQVRESRNQKMLILKNINHLSPLRVCQELRGINGNMKLSVYEYQPQQYIYVMVFRNNHDAALAHHMLRTKLRVFGYNAYFDWLDRDQTKMTTTTTTTAMWLDAKPRCCVQLPPHVTNKQFMQLIQAKSQCLCIKL